MSDPTDERAPAPSKSQRKREAQALQALGEALVGLPAAGLEAITLPERLREAVELARGLSSRGARRRQMQYIGRLMREVDPEPIRHALQSFENRRRGAATRFQRLERMRDRLLAQGDEGVEAVLAEQPGADRQRLRQLVRQARREQETDRGSRGARALFRYLREVDEGRG